MFVNFVGSLWSVLIPDIFLGNPPQKNLQSHQTAAKLCAQNLFCQDNELQIYHGNFLLMYNKHRKLFVIKQSKGCRFMPKMHQNTSGDQVPPGPAGGAYALPQTA